MAFNFVLPVIGVTVNPLWSQEFLDIFNSISSHTHTGLAGDAAKINASNLLLTQDFSLGGFNTINARSYIMQNLTSDPAGVNDVCQIYCKNGNFYYNNQLGTHIQITNGSALNVVSTVASAWSYLAVSTNFTLLNSDTYTYLSVNTTSARSIFLPAASTVPTGRFIILKDATGQSETNAISLVPSGADTIDTVSATYVVKKKFGSWMLVSNGTNGWLVSNYSNKELNDGTVRSNGSDINLIGGTHNVAVTGVNFSVTATSGVSVFATAGIAALGTTGVTIESGAVMTLIAASNLLLNATAVKVNNSFYANTILPYSGTTITVGTTGTTINLGAASSTVSIGNHLDVAGVSNLHATNVFGNFIATGSVEVDDLFLAEANAIIGSSSSNTFDVASTSTFAAPTTFNGDVSIALGKDLTALGDATLGNSSADTTTVNAVSIFQAHAFFNNDINLGNASSDNITFNGTVKSAITFGTSGRVTEPVIVTPNSNSSISVDLFKNVFIPSSTTGTRTYTITGSPVAGDFFYVFNEDSGSHNLTGLVTYTVASGNALKFMYDGSTWRSHEWFL